MSVLWTLLQLAQTVTGEAPTTAWWEWVWRLVNSAGLVGILTWLSQYLVPRLRKSREKADIAQVQAATAKTEAETATTSADEAVKRAEAAQTQAEIIHNKFEKFTLQAQRDFEANLKLRQELKDVLDDFNQVYQKMRNFEEQLKAAELRNQQLESDLAHVKEVLGGQIQALTRQNQEQGGRITELEADRAAREAYIDRIEALIPEPDRTEARQYRPNGKHKKTEEV